MNPEGYGVDAVGYHSDQLLPSTFHLRETCSPARLALHGLKIQDLE